MKRALWLIAPAVLLASSALAQQAPQAPAQPTKPAAAPAAKPAKPAAAPAAPAAASPAKPAAAEPAAAPKTGPIEWELDKAHSRIGFIARHLGFSKVEGHFNKFDATIKADAKTGKIIELEATADTSSIDTGIEKRDTHLKADDFFNAAKYPQLKLKLKKITWAGKDFTAKADLTIRDVTKEVTLKGKLLGVHTVNFGQGPTVRAGYEATAKINRKQFGLNYSAVTEGLAIVGDQVELDLAIEIGYTPGS